MANTPNPEKEGLTLRQKRALDARKYRELNGDTYRDYQRTYHRKYDRDPLRVAPKLQLRLEQIHLIMARLTLLYKSRITPYEKELEHITNQIALNQAKIDAGEVITRRNGA